MLGQAANPLSLNRYLYAWANPEAMIDPDGHAACRLGADDCAELALATPLMTLSAAAAAATGLARRLRRPSTAHDLDHDRIAAMLQYMKTHFVTVQSRGTVALPVSLRRRLHLDEPGAQIQIVEQDDGRVELRPVLPVPADQRWFWTERWQAMEREVDEHVAAGRVTVVDGPDALFEHLDASLNG